MNRSVRWHARGSVNVHFIYIKFNFPENEKRKEVLTHMHTVGIIPSPGVAHHHAKRIIPKVKKLLTERIEGDSHWNFDIKVDLMIGSAEDVHESVDKAAQLKDDHHWDYVICLTDLPSISDNKVVISDYNNDKQVAMLSLPSLGFMGLNSKLVKTVTSLIEQLYYEDPKSKNAPHRFVRMKSVEPNEDESEKRRYINTLFIISWIQLIGGLTRANQPWKNIFNFKKIISVAFATGTYISIFSMPWELSVIYSPFRLILLMIIAILGMAGWLLYAHQLLERKTAKSQRVYRYIYNSTTLVTLSVITLMNYFILYILLIISITLFVPVDLFNSWTSAKAQFTFTNYLRLIWFVASLGLLAGAMGSTVEDEEKIRRITYSYRQYHRYKEAEEEQKEQQQSQDVSHQKVEQQASSNDQQDEQYEGKKQGHREEDE